MAWHDEDVGIASHGPADGSRRSELSVAGGVSIGQIEEFFSYFFVEGGSLIFDLYGGRVF